MKGRVLSLSIVLCLSIVIAGAAQQVQPVDPEWLQQMYAEGWQSVQKGVLQRDTGGGKYETFGYGAEGLQWIGQGYRQQVEDLKSRYEASPSEELAQAIDQLEGEILRLEGIAREVPAAESFDGEAIESCAPSYGGSAFAEPQSGSPGVTARASAWFHNDCGHLGDTFTTAYAHAVASTGETTVTHSDPKNGGTWLDSFSSVSASGSSGCESWAQASVTSSELGIAYQTPQKQSFVCGYNTSIYTLDSTSWAQTGPGNLGPLTLSGTSGYTLIDSNYAPIATSGLPQAGIAFTSSTPKLEGPVVDTVSTFANASVIQMEVAGRLRGDATSDLDIIGTAYHINGVGTCGIRFYVAADERFKAATGLCGTETSGAHYTPSAVILGDTTVEAYRWVWIEDSAGASVGTGQWWRKIAGAWQLWGVAKAGIKRPLGHTQTRMRIHANDAGSPSLVRFDYQHASITIGTLP